RLGRHSVREKARLCCCGRSGRRRRSGPGCLRSSLERIEIGIRRNRVVACNGAAFAKEGKFLGTFPVPGCTTILTKPKKAAPCSRRLARDGRDGLYETAKRRRPSEEQGPTPALRHATLKPIAPELPDNARCHHALPNHAYRARKNCDKAHR